MAPRSKHSPSIPTFKTAIRSNWQLSIQQNLKASMVMTVTYAGIKGTGLPQEFVPNTYPSGAVGVPVGLPTGFSYETSGGNSSYQAGTDPDPAAVAQRPRRQRFVYVLEVDRTTACWAAAARAAASSRRTGWI